MFNPKVVTKVRGKYYYQDTAAVTTGSISLSPLSLDARCVSLSDAFMLYRFTKISVKIWQNNTTPQPLVLGYTPSIPSVAPNTIQQVLDMSQSCIGIGVIGNPAPHLFLSRKILQTNAPKWFRRGTAFDDLLELQGQIFYSTPTSFDTKYLYVMLDWEMELASPLATADTVSKPSAIPQLASTLARLRDEIKQKDLSELKRIDDYASAPRDDPILERIKDLLLRDDMVVVNPSALNVVTGKKPA